MREGGGGAWLLVGLSFAYGVFHAAGPGHGKAVISSYLFANDETWRRGLVLSFASALLQSLVAVTLVAVAALLLGATAKMMGDTVRVIETVSYTLIALMGARLTWVKGRALVGALHARWERGAVTTGCCDGNHVHASHGYGATQVTPPGHMHCDGVHDKHVHDEHASAWGHAHGPEPEELAGPGGWKRGLSAVMAVGLRPCSGAIIVLVFALAQQLFWAGVGATFVMGLGTAITVSAIATLAVTARSLAARIAGSPAGAGMLALRVAEVGAAVLVFAFGLLLLAGYIADERLFGI
jgi:nickel/cobalt exporter